ncbi:RNA ligase RtcB family protein [Massilia sp. METH4]|uniref:RNA ligase RtcB family protein n=1 Tax=Massilia sp. METH4 TaxID=3123041 RepID=UPI0030D189D6
MVNNISTVAERATVIASPRLWLEGAAIQQLIKTTQLPGMVRAVGMPDLHPGRGYPVGAAFFSAGHFYPALVGNDIGCGVSVWSTDLPTAKIKLDKLDRQIGNLDGVVDDAEHARIADAFPAIAAQRDAVEAALAAAGLDTRHMRSAGTIGRGNHFAELQRVERVVDGDAPAALADPKRLNLVVHSGSRGLGESILREHVDAFGHAGLAEGSPAAQAYLARHAAAVAFAELNRCLIAARICVRLGASAVRELDVNHNTVTFESFDGTAGWTHRKGATPMAGAAILIPGSRDALSYLVAPVAGAAAASLGSLAHGAGRKWQRADCRGRLEKTGMLKDPAKGALGSRVICRDKELVFEEAGAAYKPIDTVIDSLAGAGLVRVLAEYRPVLTYKTRGECC